MRMNMFLFGAVAFFVLNLLDMWMASGWGLAYFMFGVVFTVLWATREVQKPREKALSQ